MELVKFISFLIVVSITIMSIGITLIRGDEDLAVLKPDKFGFTIPNPFSDKPFLETNARPDGRYFLFHIPVIYNFEVLHRRGDLWDSKQSITFLGGLTDFYRNRRKNADDKLFGPIRFSMIGMTLYDNHQPEI